MDAPSSLEEIRELADLAMRPVVGKFESVALVGFPDHSNVGDSAIWLGELAYLRSQSVKVAYSCSSDSYRKENLERHTAGDTPILIHGGGYFGDIWPTGLDFMLRIIEDSPDRPIIVMPQTIHFESEMQRERARRVINKHHAMTICARDHRSADLAQEYFEHPVVLAPDSAVFLDLRSTNSGEGILYLAREDREARTDQPAVHGSGIAKTDWLRLPVPEMPARLYPAVLYRTDTMLRAKVGSCESSSWQEAAAAATRNGLARYRLQRGMHLLGSAQVVITDRLHAHILSMLVSMPHVVFDNSYGKVRAYYDTWSRGLPSVRWASKPDEAIAMAEALLETASRMR